MSLKRDILVMNVVNKIKDSKPINLRAESVKVGYSKNSRNIYKNATKRYIINRLSELGYSKEDIQERFKMALDLTLKEKDYTNFLRSNEDLARLNGDFKDKPTNVFIFSDEKKTSLINLSKRLNINTDNPSTENI